MKIFMKDFPILKQSINGNPLAYLDNASTSQKPQVMIDAISNFYATACANTHRGVYLLAEEATRKFEEVRASVAAWIGAQDPREIVFTHGTTESINLVAASWALAHCKSGDEILVSELEHHANLLPWQRVVKQTGAQLTFIPVRADGTLDMAHLDQLITKKTKFVAVTHVSNAVGTTVDIKKIISHARAVGAKVLIDAAQSVPHQRIDVTELDCDFLVFSPHKMLGPTGVGVLYVHKRLHDEMEAYQLGGGIVYESTYESATLLPMPQLLEAGTPPIAQVIGLGAAIEYLSDEVDFAALAKHEAALCAHLIDGLQALPGIRILGPLDELKARGHMVSFVVGNMHAHDVAAYLDTFGIAVRAGHHCAQPFARKLGYDASIRASFYLYNTSEEVDRCLGALRKLI
jgi:cysteine desulfurase / selenocysteine lyase